MVWGFRFLLSDPFSTARSPMFRLKGLGMEQDLGIFGA